MSAERLVGLPGRQRRAEDRQSRRGRVALDAGIELLLVGLQLADPDRLVGRVGVVLVRALDRLGRAPDLGAERVQLLRKRQRPPAVVRVADDYVGLDSGRRQVVESGVLVGRSRQAVPDVPHAEFEQPGLDDVAVVAVRRVRVVEVDVDADRVHQPVGLAGLHPPGLHGRGRWRIGHGHRGVESVVGLVALADAVDVVDERPHAVATGRRRPGAARGPAVGADGARLARSKALRAVVAPGPGHTVDREAHPVNHTPRRRPRPLILDRGTEPHRIAAPRIRRRPRHVGDHQIRSTHRRRRNLHHRPRSPRRSRIDVARRVLRAHLKGVVAGCQVRVGLGRRARLEGLAVKAALVARHTDVVGSAEGQVGRGRARRAGGPGSDHGVGGAAVAYVEARVTSVVGLVALADAVDVVDERPHAVATGRRRPGAARGPAVGADGARLARSKALRAVVAPGPGHTVDREAHPVNHTPRRRPRALILDRGTEPHLIAARRIRRRPRHVGDHQIRSSHRRRRNLHHRPRSPRRSRIDTTEEVPRPHFEVMAPGRDGRVRPR